MRTVQVSTRLDAPPELVWAAVTTPQAFVHVAGAMLRYPAAERHHARWQVGDELAGWTFLFRVLPFSRHRLSVRRVDDASRTLVSEEGGGLIRRWAHVITVEAENGRTRYTDRIDIDAGPLTLPVAAYAGLFYRYRQHRWRRLAPVLGAVAADQSG